MGAVRFPGTPATATQGSDSPTSLEGILVENANFLPRRADATFIFTSDEKRDREDRKPEQAPST